MANKNPFSETMYRGLGYVMALIAILLFSTAVFQPKEWLDKISEPYADKPLWFIHVIFLGATFLGGIITLIDTPFRPRNRKNAAVNFAGFLFCMAGVLLAVYPMVWVSFGSHLWITILGFVICLAGLFIGRQKLFAEINHKKNNQKNSQSKDDPFGLR